MERAVVCLGVRRSGDLPVLNGVLPAVASVRDWALAQGIPPDRVLTLTDEHAPLSPQPIKDAIRRLVELAVIEQLIVYFAGHGVNNRYNEYWLLSDAPADPQAAVSLSTSVDLARYAGIPHIVFISDACRTAPEAITAQYVSGSDIFPNVPPSGVEADVDMFFATTLGRPAHEARDPRASASRYTALYTEAMIDALTGRREEIIELEGTPPQGLIRPRALKKCLMEPLRAPGEAGGTPLGQTPDARITSGSSAWVSRLAPKTSGAPTPPVPPPTSPMAPPAPEYMSEQGAAALLLDVALHPERRYLIDPLTPLKLATSGESEVYGRILERSAPLDPTPLGSRCGFRIRGGRCIDVRADLFGAAILPAHGHGRAQDGTSSADQVVAIEVTPGRADPVDDVLLTFAEGTSALLPAIPEFVATVTLEDGNVVDVSYEPSEDGRLWHTYADRLDELRQLRAVTSTAAYLGVFHPEGENLETLARQMQVAKGVDPTMAIYAAYAYRAAGRRADIEDMADHFVHDRGFDFFDVTMLARSPSSEPGFPADHPLAPPFPLLSQGWVLMRSHAIDVPGIVSELERHLHQSLWTTFDPAGLDLVHELMDRRH